MTIETMWLEDQEFVDAPGVHLANDTIVPLRFVSEGGRCVSVAETRRTVSELLPSSEMEDGVVRCTLTSGDLFIQGGECIGHGSRGFVAAAVAGEGTRLLWIAYFWWSEPFVALDHRNGRVEATTSADAVWSISVQEPTDIVVGLDRYGRGPCDRG